MSKLQQQVDLYQRRFRRTKVMFSAWQVVRLSLFLVLALAATSVYTHHQTTELQLKADHLAQQSKKLESQISAIGRSNEPTRQQSVEQAIAQLKQTRNSRQRALSKLGTQNEYRNRLFSSYFEGLARRTLDGLWLQDIHIEQGGESIRLVGNAMEAELIPDFIKELKNEPAFRGITFRSATVTEQSTRGGVDSLLFSLLTHADTATSGDK